MRKRNTSGLQAYRQKRRFNVTKEPSGKVARRVGHAFVIQKHAARRLHYDLRLELDGVMKSWAVTRGPSLVAGKKRLAVQVEDHPVAYNKFEGTIPPGEYGGGTVMIWDRGHWQPEGDPHEGLAKGHLAFRLDGKKLAGGWRLVRMHPRPGDKHANWLLIKQHDDEARSARSKDILEEVPLSVKTGRSIEEIAAGAPGHKMARNSHASTTRTRSAAKIAAPSTKNKRPRRTAVRAAGLKLLRKSSMRGTGRQAAHDALARARHAALPTFVKPCLATLVDRPPTGDAWIHEIKFDGYRIQARLDHGKVSLLTRRGLDWTDKFPTVAAAVAKLPAKAALIDGELVSEDSSGISRFSLLQEDLKFARHDRMTLYAFDLMHLDGADLRPLPLIARKLLLAPLIVRGKSQGALRFSESINKPGPALLEQACKMGLEGVVSKRAASPYRSGRVRDWVKAKCSDRQELVIAGFAPSSADARAVGALVLGYYDRGKLHYAGRTGTGFTRDSARSLYRKLAPLTRKTSPLDSVPKEERGVRKPVWVEPKLVAEVDFRGWTQTSRVRQASFQGLREDKPAKQVIRETTR